MASVTVWLEAIRGSLQWRLLASLCLGVGLSLAAFLFALDSIIDRQVAHALDEQLVARAGALIADLAARQDGSFSLAHPAYGEPVYFEIVDRSGRAVATSGFRGALTMPSHYPVGQPFDLTLPDGHPARAIVSYVPDDSAESLSRGSKVVVAEDRTKADELSGAVDLAIWIGFAIILLISSGVVVLTVRNSLRPVESLGRVAARIPVNESPEMLPLGGMPREILPLGERFNRLLRRLRVALDRERDFSENLAHELRTPLAEIRALSESGGRSADPQEIRASLEQAGAAAVRMQSVTESLLALARASHQPAASIAEPVDLARMARRCLKERMRGLTASIQDRLPQELWMVTNPLLMEMILANLLRNAVEHGAPGAAVEIDWLPNDGRGLLRIRNAAPHLTHNDLADLGTRWWRRAMSPGASSAAGSGLGLSIARSLCEAVNLELSFALDAEQRLSVTLAGFTGLGAAALDSPT
ncbi:MAG: sensor histidine kinase [Steroidobacteraceae bacterium]